METNLDKSTPQGRLRYLIDKYFKGNAREFAKSIGINESSIYKYLAPDYRGRLIVLGSEYLLKLQRVGFNPQWYLTGEGDELIKQLEPNAHKSELTNKTTEVKVATKNANAGLGFTFSDLEISTTKWVYEVPDTHIFVWVSGDSMEPHIRNGSLVEVDTTRRPVDRDVVVGTYNGVLICKEYRIRNSDVCLCSYNKNYEDLVINDHNEFKLMGVVCRVTFSL